MLARRRYGSMLVLWKIAGGRSPGSLWVNQPTPWRAGHRRAARNPCLGRQRQGRARRQIKAERPDLDLDLVDFARLQRLLLVMRMEGEVFGRARSDRACAARRAASLASTGALGSAADAEGHLLARSGSKAQASRRCPCPSVLDDTKSFSYRRAAELGVALEGRGRERHAVAERGIGRACRGARRGLSPSVLLLGIEMELRPLRASASGQAVALQPAASPCRPGARI